MQNEQQANGGAMTEKEFIRLASTLNSKGMATFMEAMRAALDSKEGVTA